MTHKKMMDLIPVKEEKVEGVVPILKENENEATKVVGLENKLVLKESVDRREEAAGARALNLVPIKPPEMENFLCLLSTNSPIELLFHFTRPSGLLPPFHTLHATRQLRLL